MCKCTLDYIIIINNKIAIRNRDKVSHKREKKKEKEKKTVTRKPKLVVP